MTEGRINGNLNVSRAFGFNKFKQNKKLPQDQQIITCFPSIQVIDRNISDQFIFMACDGIWALHQKKETNLIKKIK